MNHYWATLSSTVATTTSHPPGFVVLVASGSLRYSCIALQQQSAVG